MRTTNIEVVSLYDLMVVFRGNQALAARELGINRGTIRNHHRTGKARDTLFKVIRGGDGQPIDYQLINSH